jgi:hypothetical protein
LDARIGLRAGIGFGVVIGFGAGTVSGSVIGLGAGIGVDAGIGTDDRSGGKNATLKIPPESTAITTPIVVANIFACIFFSYFSSLVIQ